MCQGSSGRLASDSQRMLSTPKVGSSPLYSVVNTLYHPVSQFGHIWTHCIPWRSQLTCRVLFVSIELRVSRSESKHWRLCATAAAVISLKGECRSGRREPDAIQVQVKNSWTSYHFISLHITSYHFISLHITSYHFISLHITSYHFMASWHPSLDLLGPTRTCNFANLGQSRQNVDGSLQMCEVAVGSDMLGAHTLAVSRNGRLYSKGTQPWRWMV